MNFLEMDIDNISSVCFVVYCWKNYSSMELFL